MSIKGFGYTCALLASVEAPFEQCSWNVPRQLAELNRLINNHLSWQNLTDVTARPAAGRCNASVFCFGSHIRYTTI